ncbi:helix-turn-helix domain-containing protein [Pseudolactococcus reticulitermitis]|uniref:HTH cro/C1-type domain-containing protein n=1 Tax=Pseudolactococcus reticulitermitis TaxID=2025039 RepID=A0A224X5S2_9LACT|nr:helix-turn-helix domain-containing protein [Lactococcus reticulitermitis]GAX47956.1 hypothetical protein RsY01_1570 [Lactococcus reticulitermitis]
MATFAERLKELRKEKGLTQKELAERVGTQQGVYTNWENGKREPKYDKVGELASELKTTSDYLLGFTDEKRLPIYSLRLIELRKEKGLSIDELTKSTKIKPELYKQWETGEKFPGFFAILKLSKNLDVTPSYLMGQTNFKTENSRIDSDNEVVKREFFEEIQAIKTSKDEDIVIRKLNNIFGTLMQAAKKVEKREYYEAAFDFIFTSLDEINEELKNN